MTTPTDEEILLAFAPEDTDRERKYYSADWMMRVRRVIAQARDAAIEECATFDVSPLLEE